jgi:hypothetical protein
VMSDAYIYIDTYIYIYNYLYNIHIRIHRYVCMPTDGIITAVIHNSFGVFSLPAIN